MIEVEIIGGPHDGRIFVLPEVCPFRVPMMTRPDAFFNEDPTASRDPCYRVVEMMPQLTSNGWRMYWHEPC